jgi:hypothetical protein
MRFTETTIVKEVPPSYHAGELVGVEYYVNPDTQQILPRWSQKIGRYWYTNLGEHLIKGQYVDDETQERLYPGFTERVDSFSLARSTDNKERKRRIDNYGTRDYTLQWSDYVPVGVFSLIFPIKSDGKTIYNMTLFNWNYIVLEWLNDLSENDVTRFQVVHKIVPPFGLERNMGKILYQSRIYEPHEKKLAIADFRRVVAEEMKK